MVSLCRCVNNFYELFYQTYTCAYLLLFLLLISLFFALWEMALYLHYKDAA